MNLILNRRPESVKDMKKTNSFFLREGREIHLPLSYEGTLNFLKKE